MVLITIYDVQFTMVLYLIQNTNAANLTDAFSNNNILQEVNGFLVETLGPNICYRFLLIWKILDQLDSVNHPKCLIQKMFYQLVPFQPTEHIRAFYIFLLQRCINLSANILTQFALVLYQKHCGGSVSRIINSFV